MSDADCTPGREPRCVAASLSMLCIRRAVLRAGVRSRIASQKRASRSSWHITPSRRTCSTSASPTTYSVRTKVRDHSAGPSCFSFRALTPTWENFPRASSFCFPVPGSWWKGTADGCPVPDMCQVMMQEVEIKGLLALLTSTIDAGPLLFL